VKTLTQKANAEDLAILARVKTNKQDSDMQLKALDIIH
jgi:hypothetical protein